MGKRKSKAFESSKSPGQGNSTSKPPAFDEDALSALTAKIEKGLESRKDILDHGENAPKSHMEQNGKSAKRRKVDGLSNPSHPKFTTKKGTKRDANGHPKLESSKDVPDIEAAGTKRSKSANNQETLLQEILALGGTAEDLDLVEGAISDDAESERDAPVDKSLQKELAQFVTALGIDPQEGWQDDGGEPSTEASDWDDVDEKESDSLTKSTLQDEEMVDTPVKTIDETSMGSAGRLTFSPRPDWHCAPLPKLPIPEVDEVSRYQEAVGNLKAYAASLLEADSNLYASKHLSATSSHKFLSTIMSSGTLSDKVSALTLVVQESPVHTTKSFENLLALAKKRSRGQAVSALGALKDLLAMGVVLPPDRRLRTFSSQPGLVATLQSSSKTTWKLGQPLPGDITKAHLIAWVYEDWLKESYFEMLKVLEGWCNDEVEYARSRAVTYVYELLKEKPEQEANLLRLLVNKLGDPDKKIASRASYLLLQLQISHPLMKSVIVSSIETELLLRPGQSLHAKYYAINTLNQTILSVREEEVAKRLLNIYFELFVTLLKKPESLKASPAQALNRKGQIQGGGGQIGKMAKAKAAKGEQAKTTSEETIEKMISAVLTGVNRAFPFSNTDNSTLEQHMDTLFRITHSSNFNTSIQALMLIEQLASAKQVAVDRFYRTLYESLLDPRLIMSSKHALYLNLLFKALKADVNVKRVKAFVKRLLQVATLHQPPFICGVLFLLGELETVLPALRTLYNDAEEAGEDEDENNSDAAPQTDTTARSHRTYDGRKRDPEYSHADQSCVWEIIPFLSHFHPSVSLFTKHLLAQERMPSKPDLASHSLTNFLDRFVYRNAKVVNGKSRGDSIMQPLSTGSSQGAVLSARASGSRSNPLNTEAFWRKKVDDVAVDEVFFHRYFNQISKNKHTSTKKSTRKAEDGSVDEDAENEDEIWQALIDSRPELEGPSDDDSDMEMLDLDDSEIESEVSWSDDHSQSEREHPGLESAELDDDTNDASSTDGNNSETGETLDALFFKEAETYAPEQSKAARESSKQRRKRMKNLPTFASMDDYVGMLDNDEDEDL